jgi:4-amino-4-deoxy-L-arabinose transferase-like glycosyltransferase
MRIDMIALRRLPPALVLALIMIGATGVRLWALESWPLWSDECWSKWISAMGWRDMFATVRAYETHPPFYYSLLKLWQTLFGDSNMSLRSLSLIASVALIPLGFALATRARVNGLVLALLIALNRPEVITGRQARPYALLALAFGFAMLTLLRIKRGANGWRDWLAYVVAFEVMLWLHAVGVFFGVALGLAMLIGLRRDQWLKFVVSHAVIGVMWLPCLQMILIQHGHRLHSWLVFNWADVWPQLVEGFVGWPETGNGLIALIVAGLGVAALVARGERALAAILLILMFVPVALEIMVSASNTPVFLARYFVPSVLPFLMLLTASISHPKYGRIGALGVAVLALFMTVTSVREITRAPEERWDAVGAYLTPRVAPGEEVWTLPNDLKMFLTYAAPPRYPVIGQPAPFPAPDYPGDRPAGTLAVPGIDAPSVTRMIAEARARHRTGVWIITSRLPLFDPSNALHGQLAAVATHTGKDADFAPMTIEHWVFKPQR